MNWKDFTIGFAAGVIFAFILFLGIGALVS